jgi:hypothetical protein
MNRKRLRRAFDEAGGPRWISEQIPNRRSQALSGLKLDNSAFFAQFVYQELKVFHVRACDDRLICE